MPATEAQISANRRNSASSTGPKTLEGKERSRGNALKHGLTGEGVVLSNEDAAEVERMFHSMEADFRPSGEAGRVLVRRIATCAVRMERGVLQETAALNVRVVQAQVQADLDGEDRDEAGRRAMFDPSREATLARKYEAAAERGFFRAIKELRQIEREAKGPVPGAEAAAIREQMDQLASFFPDAPPAPISFKPAVAQPRTAPKPVAPAWNPAVGGSFDVPITIGRAR